MNARWIKLTEQVRSNDPNHTKLIKKLYTHQQIGPNDFKKYDLLSPQDWSDPNNTEWLYAPIIVATNHEKQALTYLLAKHYATIKGTYVIHWPMNYGKWQQKPGNHFHIEAMKNRCLYEYMVITAHAFCNDNWNREIELIKGTKLIYHSLGFANPIDMKYFLNKVALATPGDVITLLHPPLTVNVELNIPKDNADTKPELIKAWTTLSIIKDKIIIAIPQSSNHSNKIFTIIPGTSHYKPSRIEISPQFPIEMAFAITVHKAQGQTLDQVILALSHRHAAQCDMSYSHVYVATSRIHGSTYLRLLLTGTREKDKWESLKYLNNLHPDKSIPSYFASFSNQNANQTNWKTTQLNQRQSFNTYSTTY